ncbi:MAG TPA: VOC family protein [Bdellovibrionota bacterium]|nr:VOC family protein [Bdellovibrionota bacterium]
MLKKVHHAQVSIPAGEERTARAFYVGLLGLNEIEKPATLREGRGGFWMELAGFQIHVGTDEVTERFKSKAHLAYEVEDLESWRARLMQAGVAVQDGKPIPGYRRFEFRDPFGNRIEFLGPA